MTQDDPRRADAPAPVRRQHPSEPSGRVENPAVASARAPQRVVPEGFSRGEDAIYEAQWGRQQQAWQQPAAQQQGWQQPGAWSQPAWQQAAWQQPAGGWQPPAPSRARVPAALPLGGQVYAQALRPLQRRVGRWFLAWAIAIGFFALGQLVAVALMMPTILELFADPETVALDAASLTERLISTPMAFLGVNLSWAAMIPGAVVALAAYGDRAMGFAFSVAGRWRWGLVGRSALVVAPIFAVYVGIVFAIDPSIEWRFQPDWLLVAIVLLTTPLQSSGEEFAFRGIVTQQLGSWMRNAWVSSLVTGGVIGLVFGLAHAGYPPLAILQVSLVGFTCAMLTFRTGGLEAACVVHSANNVFIMLPLALMGVSPFSTSTGDEGPFGAQLAGFLACMAALALSYLAVHLMSKRWQRRTEGAPGAELLLLPRAQSQPVAVPVVAYGQAPAAGYGAWSGAAAPQQGWPQQAPQQGWPQQAPAAAWGAGAPAASPQHPWSAPPSHEGRPAWAQPDAQHPWEGGRVAAHPEAPEETSSAGATADDPPAFGQGQGADDRRDER